MDAKSGYNEDVRETSTPPASAIYSVGDLVEFGGGDAAWEVDLVVDATPYKPACLVLGRSESGPGWARGIVTDAAPGQVRLRTPARERRLYGGEDVSRWTCVPDPLFAARYHAALRGAS